jgi:predicted enzyme related to lactoylglutathione lyase
MSETATLSKEEMLAGHAIAQGKTFVWHQIYAANSQASIDFYTQALDWGTHDFPMGDSGTYKMLTANGSAVAGVVGTHDEGACEEVKQVPPHWSVSIGVDDVDARVAKCKSLGATVLQEPTDIPTVGRMALIQDPQGAQIWLFQPAI